MTPDILTASGKTFDFVSPQPDQVDIYDIARGLSNICRFGGQCNFYSVAQHSVHVSHIVPEHLAYPALLHDMAEAYIGDVPKPLKMLLPDYMAIEARVEAVLFPYFGISLPLDPKIKQADRIALATEKHHLMVPSPDWEYCEGAQALKAPFKPLLPRDAFDLFIQRYYELFPGTSS